MKSIFRCCFFFVVFLLRMALPFKLAEAKAPDFNQQVQAPVLEPTKRGSLVGELSSFAQDGNDLMKGGLRFVLPLKFPEDRGKLLFPLAPSYAITQGISEFGMGFKVFHSISRHRRQGGLQFTDDEFVSPWGTLVKGEDGFFYPEGLQSPVRLRHTPEDQWLAYLEDGSQLTFGGEEARIVTKKGTYAWYLTCVQSALHEQTIYSYLKPEGSGDWPILERVLYGGKGTAPQYEITLHSSRIKRPFLDYRSGERTTLRRRVERISLSVLTPSGFVERFSYFLNYREGSNGSAFYLTELRKKYRSGAEEPPFVMDYNDSEDFLKKAKWIPTENFNPLLKKVPNAFVPERHSIFNVQEDGKSELEFANSFSHISVQEGHFEWFPLPEWTTDLDPYCRPNPTSYPPTPRIHRKMKGALSPLEVVGFETRFKSHEPFVETTLHVCDLEGQLIQKVKLPGYDLRPGSFVKLVDLSRNEKPALVWIGQGSPTSRENQYGSEIRLHVFENISTDDTVVFRDVFQIKLDGVLPREASYALFQDINGDGILDFVLVQSSGIAVWYGKGDFEFEKEPVFIPFRVPGGTATKLYEMRINFHDLNGDGLPEAVVLSQTGASIFINQGKEFVLQERGPLAGRSWAGHAGRPIVFDLLGTGNPQIVAQDLTEDHVKIIELAEAGTGLLRRISDGKGNQVDLSYRRMKPTPGIRYRFPVLEQTVLTLAGEGSKTERYFFAEPAYHSQDRGFLGFQKIVKENDFGKAEFVYQYGDQQPGVLSSRKEIDFKIPDLVKILQQGFKRVSSFGIPWLRLSLTEEGFEGSEKEGFGLKPNKAVQQTSFSFLAEEHCPSAIQVHNQHGTAQYEIQYFNSSEFQFSLHCLMNQFSVKGESSKEGGSFSEGLKIKRNEQGQPLSIVRLGAVPKVLQKLEYTPTFQIQSIVVPGSGKTLFSYDPSTTLLVSVTTPEGVVQTVDRDLFLDEVKELRETRGAPSFYRQFFEFDPFERLAHSFEKLSSVPSRLGETAYRYAFATEASPAWIETLKKVGDLDQNSSKKTLSLLSSSGVELGTLVDLGGGGVLTHLQSKRVDQRKTAHLSSKSFDYDLFLSHPTFSALYSGTLLQREKIESFFNLDFQETQLHQSGATGIKDFHYSIESNQVIQRMREKGSILWLNRLDSQGKVMSRVFPNGSTYLFEYDVLGRFLGAILPSGEGVRVQYNEYGEVARLSRSGLGSILFSYQPSTPLLEKKEYFNESGKLIRSVHWDYDANGRKIRLTYQEDLSGDKEVFRYYYDGNNPDGSFMKGQNGRLTALVGPSLQKNWLYREDGKVLTESWRIEDFGMFSVHYEYDAEGRVKKRKLERKDPNGRSKLDLQLTFHSDAYGRESSLTLDDTLLYKIQYDSLSRVHSVRGPQLNVDFEFDSETQKERGFKQSFSKSQFYSTAWDLNSRGLLIKEKFYTSKDDEVHQVYQYSDVGYLSHFERGSLKREYFYEDDQWVAGGIWKDQPFKVTSEGGQWKSEVGNYNLDSLGRVVKKKNSDGLTRLIYGPQGRVSKVLKPSLPEITYLYDDEGKRIVKKRGGKIVEVYIGRAILTPEALLEPIQIDKRIFGYLENKVFKVLASDARNSIVSDEGHTLQVPEPYGERDRTGPSPLRSALVDYALVGYDEDLMAYRTEQRDYDPVMKRFLTPDSFFLEHPEKCVESPIECNLYSYAKNNPVHFVDPSGKSSQRPEVNLNGAFPNMSQVLDQTFKTVVDSALKTFDNIWGTAYKTIGEFTGANNSIRVGAGVEPWSITASNRNSTVHLTGEQRMSALGDMAFSAGVSSILSTVSHLKDFGSSTSNIFGLTRTFETGAPAGPNLWSGMEKAYEFKQNFDTAAQIKEGITTHGSMMENK